MSATPDTPSKAARLIDGANRAYDLQAQAWFNALPTDHLAFLWGAACADTSGGANWDDEVFDALDARGWFDQ